ncbi:MAG TPA: hypothetical protein VGH28_19940 [Polyangiaceae bacterium]|jgi:hypothetical protein
MASNFEQEPITARRTVSPALLRESRNPLSVRPTTPVPSVSWPSEDPIVSVVEVQELDEDDAKLSTLFEVREINASRTRDPRSE